MQGLRHVELGRRERARRGCMGRWIVKGLWGTGGNGMKMMGR